MSGLLSSIEFERKDTFPGLLLHMELFGGHLIHSLSPEGETSCGAFPSIPSCYDKYLIINMPPGTLNPNGDNIKYRYKGTISPGKLLLSQFEFCIDTGTLVAFSSAVRQLAPYNMHRDCQRYEIFAFLVDSGQIKLNYPFSFANSRFRGLNGELRAMFSINDDKPTFDFSRDDELIPGFQTTFIPI